MAIEIDDLFAAPGLAVCGPVDWGVAVPERGSGLYAIVAPEAELDEHIVYIGRATSLRKRLAQFYRHIYGRKSPHRGGQEILLLPGARAVYWATAHHFGDAEHRLLEAYEAAGGRKPYGNKVRSARIAIRNS